MDRLSAEIAGGGIAGLGLGTLLTRRGWRVRIHERDTSIREVGAGIYLRNNLLRVLDEIAVGEQVRDLGTVLLRSQWRDGSGRLRQDHRLQGDRRVWMCSRQVLIEALEGAAAASGVEIVLGSQVAGARSDGALILEGGEEHHADLVVGADGQSSAVRESLGLTRRYSMLPTLATRFLLTGRSVSTEPKTSMYWSGHRRVGVADCGEGGQYVFLICPENDESGRRVPIDVEGWTAEFPVLSDLFPELRSSSSIQHNYILVHSRRWQLGRVALLGDAAHALPPLLGQGAGLALSNAAALAHSLGTGIERDHIPQALTEWERKYRRYTDATQNWSVRLDSITNGWPRVLMPLRDLFIWFIGRVPYIQRRIRIADSFPIASLTS